MLKGISSVVIPAAGKGKRMAGYTRSIPKPMIRINDHPILEYTICRAKRMGARVMYLIIGKNGGMIKHYFADGSALDTEIIYLRQEQPLGIGHAILLAEDFIEGRFGVLLGDEIYIASNHEEMPLTFTKDVNCVIGLMRTSKIEMIKRNYSVTIHPEKNRIISLIEKPVRVTDNILGVGTYLFDSMIFDAIKKTPPGKKNEIEITDSINTLCQMDAVVKPFFLRGEYLNVTYPEDIDYATKMILQDPFQANL
ncbi:MAG: sugar phosphate nucleotidyltransferase [Candidatus Ranarchaeia archaeon]